MPSHSAISSRARPLAVPRHNKTGCPAAIPRASAAVISLPASFLCGHAAELAKV